MRDLFFYCLGLFTIPGLVMLGLITLAVRSVFLWIRRQRAAAHAVGVAALTPNQIRREREPQSRDIQ